MVNSYVKKRQSTFFVKEGSLMAKGLHQGLLGSIRYPSTSPLFKAVLNKTTYCIYHYCEISLHFCILDDLRNWLYLNSPLSFELSAISWTHSSVWKYTLTNVSHNVCDQHPGAWWGRLFNVGWKSWPAVCWALAAEPHPLPVLHLRSYPRRHKENIMFVSVSSIVI